MYQFFKYMLWATLVIFFFYLLALGLAYFTSAEAVQAFKTYILPFGYFIPFVLIICFLGLNYFKEEDWLEDSHRKLRPRVFYSWVSINIAAIVVVYFLFVKEKSVLVANANVTPATAKQKLEPAKGSNDNLDKIEPRAASEVDEDVVSVNQSQEIQANPVIDPRNAEPVEMAAHAKSTGEKGIVKGNKEQAYRPISKAYFYQEPDERTQRKVFIKDNPSSNPLKARDEKNGFVYVIVQDKKGTPTIGWLQKKDLKSVTMVFNDGKE